ncbi:Deoxyribodipyrimidine photo-lyase [Clavibacter michiganensis subsp. michiganensis]|uniref:Deoxyribodipyrimidine photo-lyase n=1 Tax=Clavibacter michiganensis subsp. michiganensis TaxID=33013 RepID=A0A251XP05_CLAMM|nr:Deoxyribodipyrimidine photo-lyase [Clavibacter michiganensis subsp. michiganensis]OUE05191.1 Deoxyribodipyrimidine photo-lyase [Clavibacter michiganensis subsp. michiganensis]
MWLRDDLRVADNPALHAAVERGEPIVVLYVLDEESDGIRPLGGAARWWLHMSLSRLAESLRELGSDLVLRRGKAADVVDDLVREIGAGAVLWNRRYGGAEIAVDTAIKKDLGDRGLDVRSFQGSLLVEPWTVTNKQGEPFRVYTPFWKAAQEREEPRKPLPRRRSSTRRGRHPARTISTAGGCCRRSPTGRPASASRAIPARQPACSASRTSSTTSSRTTPPSATSPRR